MIDSMSSEEFKKLIKKAIEPIREQLNDSETGLKAINLRLNDPEIGLGAIKDKLDANTASVIGIETTIKGYGDM